MKELIQDIKNHSFRPVYLIYGEEAYLKNDFKKKLKDAILGEDTMNFQSFYGKETDIKEVISLADTMPFFAEKRLILIENSGLFKKDAEPLTSYLSSMPDTTVLVFVEDQVDARGKFFKQVKKLGLAVNMERQKEDTLKTWILTILKKNGRNITPRAMELFLNSVGDNMELISTELEKLICYTTDTGAIYPEDVMEICSVQMSSHIFDMITDIAAHRQKAALDKYYELLALKEPAPLIMVLISRQFNQLLMVKELVLAGKGKDEIAKKVGIPAFVASKQMGLAKSYRMSSLRKAVEKCTEAEYSFKSGRLGDRMAVELLISELSSKELLEA